MSKTVLSESHSMYREGWVLIVPSAVYDTCKQLRLLYAVNTVIPNSLTSIPRK